jgi:23S rRNA pseudouridine1911/1915/1917 synthase
LPLGSKEQNATNLPLRRQRNPCSRWADLKELFEILYEDAELLVVNKPAGLVCHPTKGDEYSSLISRARLHLGGEACHMINRLDRETSGVTVIAKNALAAGELGKLWEKRAVQKTYLAIVHGKVTDASGTIDLSLGKDEKSQVAVKDCVRSDGVPACTDYWLERHFCRDERPFSLLRVVPRTGRKHQIRIHMAAIGHPIVGDKLYGGDEDLYLALVQDRLTDEQRSRLLLSNHALHAVSLQFSWRGTDRQFQAQPEQAFWAFMGLRLR